MKKISALLFTCFAVLFFFSKEASAESITEVEPNDTPSEAQLIPRNNHNPVQMLTGDNYSQKVVNGNIDSSNDVDWYKVALPADPKTVLSINSSLYLNFEVYDSNLNRIFQVNYLKDPMFLGAAPFWVNIPTAGEYYVKASSPIGSVGSYLFTIGSPNYTVGSYDYTSPTTLTLTPTINSITDTLDLRNITNVPKDATVYNVIFGGQKVNSASSEYRRIKLSTDSAWINTRLYSWVADIPATSNKRFHNYWDIRLEGSVSNLTGSYSLKPEIKFTYFYPILPTQ